MKEKEERTFAERLKRIFEMGEPTQAQIIDAHNKTTNSVEPKDFIYALEHKDIERIRNSKSDAEVRRILLSKTTNKTVDSLMSNSVEPISSDEPSDEIKVWLKKEGFDVSNRERTSWFNSETGTYFNILDVFNKYLSTVPKEVNHFIELYGVDKCAEVLSKWATKEVEPTKEGVNKFLIDNHFDPKEDILNTNGGCWTLENLFKAFINSHSNTHFNSVSVSDDAIISQSKIEHGYNLKSIREVDFRLGFEEGAKWMRDKQSEVKEVREEELISFMKWYKNSVPIGTQKLSKEIVNDYLTKTTK